jgi:hypothetical protein
LKKNINKIKKSCKSEKQPLTLHQVIINQLFTNHPNVNQSIMTQNTTLLFFKTKPLISAATSFCNVFLQRLFATSFCNVFLQRLFATSFCNVFLQRLFLGDPVSVPNPFSYKFKSKNHFGVFYAHLWQLLRKSLA